MSSLWNIWRRIFFLRDAESVHSSIVRSIRNAKKVAPWSLRLASGVPFSGPRPSNPVHTVLGMDFLSRVGLAGGFDKNAEIIDAIPDLGFGFGEIGTVTPRPQPGNERPRLFRDVASAAIFNRMGFNNEGAEVIARRLREARPRLPPLFRVGVNVGKNRDTPAELAAQDYAKAAVPFLDLADFFVINVSSPNTPGLRSLQTEDSLKRILGEVLGSTVRANHSIPVLVKLAPELQGDDLRRAITAGEASGASGWVLTNTLAGTWPASASMKEAVTGGWSGSVLTQRSRERLVEARQLTTRPIISVGGIMSEAEAVVRLKLGADLIQAYSGWIFEGPTFPSRLSRAIERC